MSGWAEAAQGLGSAIGGAMGGSAGPSSADAIFSTNLDFDNSGWNVAFGGSKVDSTSEKTTSQSSDGSTSKDMSSYLPYAILFVGALVAIKALKK